MLSLERYEVEEELARGGMGVVYRARDRRTRRDVALKVVVDPDPSLRKRFLQEGQVLAKLRHPQLPAVHDLGEEGGLPYLALELIEGENLHARLRRLGRPPLGWTLEALATIAEALEYCHGRGVVHRDVKLGNVMLERATERLVLVDFGLVRRDGDAMPLADLDGTRLSMTGEVLGTPAYMAPEQIQPGRWGPIGPRTDVYGVGAALFELLTGEAPFQGTGVADVVQAALQDAPPDPRSLASGIPGPVAELCLRCLAKDPAARPGSAAEVAAALRAARLSEAGTAPLPAAVRAAPRRRTPLAALGAAGALVGLGALGAWAALRGRVEPAPAVEPPPEARASSTPTPAVDPGPASAIDPAARGEAQRLREEGLRRLDAGDAQGALALLEACARADATYAQGWNTLGYARQAVRDFDGALSAYTRALELRPEYAAALINRGAELERRGLIAEALEDYGRGLVLEPMPEGWVNRASLLARQGRFEEARADATRALELDPQLARAWDTRGWTRRELGDLEGALDDATRSTALAPDDPICWSNLAAVHMALGRPELAADAYARMLALDPRDALTWYERGKVLLTLDELGEAERHFTRAIELRPDVAPYWLDRGSVRAKLEDYPGVVADYRRALELDPDAPWADDARAAVQRLAGAR